MKASLSFAVLIFITSCPGVYAQTPAQLEASGDTLGARTALARAAQASPNNVAALTAYAEFLDRYGDPQARDAYSKVLAALRTSGDSTRAAAVSRRMALLDLIAGNKPSSQSMGKALEPWPTATIPGPLRGFARM